MKNLLYKEIRLALHPAAVGFLALAALVVIPSYPYFVTFFYSCLGVFFICQSGRENHDIDFTLGLPIPKRQAVKARFALCVLLELAQVALAVPFAILRNALISTPNPVGMNANIAFFALSLLMLGLFNLSFFTRYYKNPLKVGTAFIVSSVVIAVFMLITETAAHILPALRAVNTTDFSLLPQKFAMLGVGMVAFAALTTCSYLISAKRFEKLDT